MEEINNPEKQQNLKFIPVLMTSASEFLHQKVFFPLSFKY
jgi:hypothetical protein